MTVFNFYRAGHRWALKIEACQENGLELPITIFPAEVTDEDITQLAITLAKGDNISTNIDFTEH